MSNIIWRVEKYSCKTTMNILRKLLAKAQENSFDEEVLNSLCRELKRMGYPTTPGMEIATPDKYHLELVFEDYDNLSSLSLWLSLVREWRARDFRGFNAPGEPSLPILRVKRFGCVKPALEKFGDIDVTYLLMSLIEGTALVVIPT